MTTVEEEAFDKEKVEELVADLNADDLYPVIAEAGPEKLAAIKEAEEAGKERKGVLSAIATREAELEDRDEEGGDAVETWETAPVDEAIPIIGLGFWVRLGSSRGIPTWAQGRDGVVRLAPVKRAQGQDTLSEKPYEYQDGSEVFVVRLRDTGEFIETTRDGFQAFAPEQAGLLRGALVA